MSPIQAIRLVVEAVTRRPRPDKGSGGEARRAQGRHPRPDRDQQRVDAVLARYGG